MTLGLPHPALSLLGVSPPSRVYFSYILAAFFHATTTHRVVCGSAFLTHDQERVLCLWFILDGFSGVDKVSSKAESKLQTCSR
jgi:hypothetical protein